MTRFFDVMGIVFARDFRALLFSKKTFFFVAACSVYVIVIGFLFRLQGDSEDQNSLFAYVTQGAMLQAIVPMTALFYSISAVREEIVQRTLVYLDSSPVSRSSVWIGKFLAASAAAEVVCLGGLACGALAGRIFGGVARSGEEFAASTALGFGCGAALAAIAYAAVGTLVALRFKRPMVVGAVFLFGWESFAGSTPAFSGVRSLTVVDAVRNLVQRVAVSAGEWRRDMEYWAGGGRSRVEAPSIGASVEAIAWFTGVCLILALLTGRRREYESKE